MKTLKRILLGFVIIIAAAACIWFGRFKVEDICAHKKIVDMNSYMKTVDDIKVSDNVNVVAIGEAAHGCKDFQELKLSVLKKMVKDYDFRAFALEADYGECAAINRYIQGGDGDIESIVPSAKVVRIMPNTPVEVGAGVVGVSVGHNIESTEVEYVLSLFNSLGLSEVIVEKDMAGLTALSGSGPAYGYLFIEALADGAVLNGLRREIAYRLAAHTVIGAAKMILETGKHPGKLKDNVCSPSGSTIEAVRILEEKNFRSAVIECEKACFEKLKEM